MSVFRANCLAERLADRTIGYGCRPWRGEHTFVVHCEYDLQELAAIIRVKIAWDTGCLRWTVPRTFSRSGRRPVSEWDYCNRRQGDRNCSRRWRATGFSARLDQRPEVQSPAAIGGPTPPKSPEFRRLRPARLRT